MNAPSSIRMLLPAQHVVGPCILCGASAILKWHDLELGRIGDCCYRHVVKVDNFLNRAGVGRPTYVRDLR